MSHAINLVCDNPHFLMKEWDRAQQNIASNEDKYYLLKKKFYMQMS